jgi:hypothetical protein
VGRTPQTTEAVAVRVAQFVVIDIICAIIALRKERELRQSTERIEVELTKQETNFDQAEKRGGVADMRTKDAHKSVKRSEIASRKVAVKIVAD